jgi:hypothetical protein
MDKRELVREAVRGVEEEAETVRKQLGDRASTAAYDRRRILVVDDAHSTMTSQLVNALTAREDLGVIVVGSLNHIEGLPEVKMLQLIDDLPYPANTRFTPQLARAIKKQNKEKRVAKHPWRK